MEAGEALQQDWLSMDFPYPEARRRFAVAATVSLRRLSNRHTCGWPWRLTRHHFPRYRCWIRALPIIAVIPRAYRSTDRQGCRSAHRSTAAYSPRGMRRLTRSSCRPATGAGPDALKPVSKHTRGATHAASDGTVLRTSRAISGFFSHHYAEWSRRQGSIRRAPAIPAR